MAHIPGTIGQSSSDLRSNQYHTNGNATASASNPSVATYFPSFLDIAPSSSLDSLLDVAKSIFFYSIWS